MLGIEFKTYPDKLNNYKLTCIEVDGLYHVEIWIVTEDYHNLLPFDDDFKKAEQEKDLVFLNFWSKYRRGQKRYKYTKEDLLNKFKILKSPY